MIVQRWGMGQLVFRGVPLTRSSEELLAAVGRKLRPWTARTKLVCAPEKTLDGRIVSITGPERSATVAVADEVGSAALVAMTEMAFGEGATAGAVQLPALSIEPHDGPEHPGRARRTRRST